MAVRRLLRAEGVSAAHADAPLVMQFSSLSSVGKNADWLRELSKSLCGGDGGPTRTTRACWPSLRVRAKWKSMSTSSEAPRRTVWCGSAVAQ